MDISETLLKIAKRGTLSDHTIEAIQRMPDEGQIVSRLQKRMVEDPDVHRLIHSTPRLRKLVLRG